MQRHAEGALLEGGAPVLAGLLEQALGARVLALLMAPDAVVGLVERAREARAGVREREALAAPDVVQRVHDIAGLRIDVGPHEVHRIDALGRTEEDAAAISAPSLGGVRRPRGEALGECEVRRVRGLVAEPFEHPGGECELVENPTQPGGDFLLESRAVERFGRVGLDLQHRAPLHELALHPEERGQAMVAVVQVLPRLLDAEKTCHEPVHVRPDGDQQLGFLPVVEGGRLAAGLEEALDQGRIGLAQPGDEGPVQAFKPVAAVKIGEFEAEGELEGLRGGRHQGRFYRMGGGLRQPDRRIQ